MINISNTQLLTYSRDELDKRLKWLSTYKLKQLCGELYILRYCEYNIDYDSAYSTVSNHIYHRKK